MGGKYQVAKVKEEGVEDQRDDLYCTIMKKENSLPVSRCRIS